MTKQEIIIKLSEVCEYLKDCIDEYNCILVSATDSPCIAITEYNSLEDSIAQVFITENGFKVLDIDTVTYTDVDTEEEVLDLLNNIIEEV